MKVRSLLAALVLAGCQRATTDASPRATLPVANHGARHADPRAPFELSVSTRPLDAREAEVKLRLSPRAELPSVTLGVDLTQSVTITSGDAARTFSRVAAGAPVELTLRVRRDTTATAGITLRAWAEARTDATVLGDEQPFTLFGDTPAEQPSAMERVIRAPDGGLLHDTIIR